MSVSNQLTVQLASCSSLARGWRSAARGGATPPRAAACARRAAEKPSGGARGAAWQPHASATARSAANSGRNAPWSMADGRADCACACWFDTRDAERQPPRSERLSARATRYGARRRVASEKLLSWRRNKTRVLPSWPRAFSRPHAQLRGLHASAAHCVSARQAPRPSRQTTRAAQAPDARAPLLAPPARGRLLARALWRPLPAASIILPRSRGPSQRLRTTPRQCST